MWKQHQYLRKEIFENLENYRPVIFSPLPKVDEKLLQNLVYKPFRPIQSKYQYDVRQGCPIQSVLLVMIEKWSKGIDNKRIIEALLTDIF